MKIGRRAVLVLLALVGIGYGFFRSWHAVKVFFTGATREVEPEGATGRGRQDTSAVVAVVGGMDVKAMVHRAVALAGGLEALELSGAKVLVKPNVVGSRGNPTTTNPAVVREVVALLYEQGAATVYVGDMSALIRGGTAGNMERTGIAAAAGEAGAQIVFFEDHSWVKVPVKGRYLTEVEVSEWIFNVDRVINLPVIKTHRYAGYSICLKNFVGATHFSQRPYAVDREHWEEVVAELNLAYRPDMNIVDGTKTMISGGPWQGAVADTNLMMAGTDRLACDVAGLGLIKSFGEWERLQDTSPWDMRQVQRAVELGLGAASGRDVELVTAHLDDDPGFAERMEKVRFLTDTRLTKAGTASRT